MNTTSATTSTGPTRPTSQPTSAWIANLAFDISEDGIDAHEAAVGHVVLMARLAGSDMPSLDVLDDLDAPAVTRERAFGMVQRRWDTHLGELDRLLQSSSAPLVAKAAPAATTSAPRSSSSHRGNACRQ